MAVPCLPRAISGYVSTFCCHHVCVEGWEKERKGKELEKGTLKGKMRLKQKVKSMCVCVGGVDLGTPNFG